MSKSDLRKELFEIHSADLHSICPDVDNAFRCPICLSLFSAKDLDERLDDGHIWPEELRKTSELAKKHHVLLCKSCNSNAGSHGDSHIQTVHKIRVARKSGEQLGTQQFQLMKDDGESFFLRGEMTFDQDSLKGDLRFPAKINKPSELRAFHQASLAGKNFMILEYNVRPHRTELAQVGLITAGYLLAFYTFGYRYIVQEEFNAVRAYILASFEYKQGPSPDLPNLSTIAAFEHKKDPYLDPVAAIVLPLNDKFTAHFQVMFLNYIVQLPFQCIPEVFKSEILSRAPLTSVPNDKTFALYIIIGDNKMNRPEWVWDKVLGTFPVTFAEI